LPSSYLDSASDGPLTLTAFLRNAAGISAPLTSNTVTIMRTPPSLASATVTNADPTNDVQYNLTYGSITGTYNRYCILENSTSVGSCSWVTGTLPASYSVTPVNGPKILSIWI